MVDRDNIKVLLLNGSPYTKEADTLNTQLFLLPHTGNNRSLLNEPEFAEQAWQVNTPEEFVSLPVVSQLTTSHVARYYGQKDEQGTFIQYGEAKCYVPTSRLHSIEFPLDADVDLTPAITSGLFRLNSRHLLGKDKDSIERLVKIAWASSRLAIRTLLERILDTPGGSNAFKLKAKSNFLFTLEERRKVLEPLVQQLRQETYSTDIKLAILLRLLQKHKTVGEKVVIFCERRATVVYLASALSALLPNLNVAATLREETLDSFGMKETRKLEKLMKQFAPVAHQSGEKDRSRPDVLISMGANGEDVMMQDASVVIYYDIDWTPIDPIQRASRSIRLQEPRTLHLYTFVPTLATGTDLASDLMGIQQHGENRIIHPDESQRLEDLPTQTPDRTQGRGISGIASHVRIRSGQVDLTDLADVEISPYYQHKVKLQQHRQYAKRVASDIISAKTYPASHPTVYVLLKQGNRYRGIVYNTVIGQLREFNPLTLLDLITCHPDTPIANVNVDYIDALADECVQAWCEQEKINPDEVSRECTLYLKPEQHPNNIEELLYSHQK
ncbi:MAG: helicase-related protein [Leptolyngbyaceae cyanobacterium bins.59]|nr:helicase-related protein [Leptolyngbyaceae cyanobacterium bins.59]